MCSIKMRQKTKKKEDMESRIKLLHIGEVKGISRKRVKGDLRLTTSTKQRTPLGGCGKEFSKEKN